MPSSHASGTIPCCQYRQEAVEISPKHPYLLSSPSPPPQRCACPLIGLDPFLQAQPHMVYTAEPRLAQPNLHAYLAACLLPAQPLAQVPPLPPAHYAQQLCHTPNISQLTQGPAHVPPLMYHSVCTGDLFILGACFKHLIIKRLSESM